MRSSKRGGGETAVVGVSLWLDDSGVYHVSTCALPYGRMVGDVLNGSWENSPICQLFGDPDIVTIK